MALVTGVDRSSCPQASASQLPELAVMRGEGETLLTGAILGRACVGDVELVSERLELVCGCGLELASDAGESQRNAAAPGRTDGGRWVGGATVTVD